MSEFAVSATDLRDRSSDLLDRVEQGVGRVLIRKHGTDRAYLINVRELRALEETLAILENQHLLSTIVSGMADINAGRLRDAADAFADLDAEFKAKD